MKIEIVQSKFNFVFDQYKIFIDGELIYTAKSKFFTVLPKVVIRRLSGEQVFVVVKDSPDINRLNYILENGQNSSVAIYTDSFIEFTIRNSKGTIHFCEQKNNVIGVFLNDIQFGLIDKNRIVSFGGDRYTVELDKGKVAPLVIIGFIIAYDQQFRNVKDTIPRFDIGNIIITPVKKIDPSWKPKQ